MVYLRTWNWPHRQLWPHQHRPSPISSQFIFSIHSHQSKREGPMPNRRAYQTKPWYSSCDDQRWLCHGWSRTQIWARAALSHCWHNKLQSIRPGRWSRTPQYGLTLATIAKAGVVKSQGSGAVGKQLFDIPWPQSCPVEPTIVQQVTSECRYATVILDLDLVHSLPLIN